ncbi:hypothetical protein B0T26DRAFT_651462 [Lasiosphaeria miniovina]|uniref:Rhodopsin domain-containing protein n=1 Tax=Lasiosphaeria miniovina TaxID=1954250 RepID=A0AA40AE15_9PEZI|nr:uncharacterized protein B0T26DRAFT_651462 [Lasiosphaeria miniovina]KAK0714179.1 hypothetical protein B0T26DRAFT_651462 [Lasiosphaeria miniovina]
MNSTASTGGLPDPNLIPSPPSDAANSLAHSFAAVAITLNVISFMLFSGRLYTRAFPVFIMGWDDYVISAAWIFIVSNSTMLLLTVPYVFRGDPSAFTLADVMHSDKLATLSQPVWAWSMATIKISVAGMLLRLERQRAIRRVLWALIWLQLVVCIYVTLSSTLQCIPLRAAWDLLGLVTDAKCWSKQAIRVNSICVASFNIVTDVIFALAPMMFLRRVQIPLRERVVIGVLMALGIFAAAASVVKAVIAAEFGKTDDSNLEGISMGTWSLVEEQIAFIAACIPCLRRPLQQVLRRFGLATTVNTHSVTAKPTGAGSGYGMMNGNHSTSYNGAIKMKSMTSSQAQSEEDILAPQRGNTPGDVIGDTEIWRTTEVRVHSEREIEK